MTAVNRNAGRNEYRAGSRRRKRGLASTSHIHVSPVPQTATAQSSRAAVWGDQGCAELQHNHDHPIRRPEGWTAPGKRGPGRPKDSLHGYASLASCRASWIEGPGISCGLKWCKIVGSEEQGLPQDLLPDMLRRRPTGRSKRLHRPGAV